MEKDKSQTTTDIASNSLLYTVKFIFEILYQLINVILLGTICYQWIFNDRDPSNFATKYKYYL